MNRSQQLTLFGGIIIIFSIFLPWATHTSSSLNLSASINGYSTDGAFSGYFGLVLILIALIYKGRFEKRYSYIVAFLAFVSLYLTLRTLFGTDQVIRTSGDTINSIRIGPYLSILGALMAFTGGIMKIPPPIYDRKTTPPR